MAEVYGEKSGHLLADEVWLRDAGENDWIVLTKDDAIRRRPAERDALTEAAVRVFCLTNRTCGVRSRQREHHTFLLTVPAAVSRPDFKDQRGWDRRILETLLSEDAVCGIAPDIGCLMD